MFSMIGKYSPLSLINSSDWLAMPEWYQSDVNNAFNVYQ